MIRTELSGANVGARSAARLDTPPAGNIRFVAIGGGTGLPAVLRALRLLVSPATPSPSAAITAVVTVTDDGGSSGQLRRQLQMLPPGDARNCVAALAGDSSRLGALLQYRFSSGSGLDGHPVGNLILAALTQQFDGDFHSAVQALSRMMGIGGRVLPATADAVHLRAEYVNGEVAFGETEIVSRRLPIRRLSLERAARPLPQVIEALVNADVIIVGPGSLYTSILPVLLVDGVAPTIFGIRATKILVANLMTEPGETDGFSLDDHLSVIRQHTGFDLFDYVLVNRQPPDPVALAFYEQRGSTPIRADGPSRQAARPRNMTADLAAERLEGKIRHEPRSLAAAIQRVLRQCHRKAGRPPTGLIA